MSFSPFKIGLIRFLIIVASIWASPGYSDSLDSLKLHSVSIKVTDVEKSQQFYQELLGLPLLGRQGETAYFRIGDGTQYLSMSPVAESETPRIVHIGLSAANFDSDKFSDALSEQGYSHRNVNATNQEAGLSIAKTYWMDDGLLYFADVEGVVIQVSDNTSCGAANFDCGSAKPLPGKLSLQEINHFTTFVANFGRANEFYMDLLGLGIQSYQGPTTPAIAVGDGKQFLMFVGGSQSGPPRSTARIHHVSLSVTGFDVEGIFGKLKSYGFKPRADGVNVAPPLSYYVSQRMPNRGGAEGGTPEVYFTDPDGILLQVQDPSYCGGGGYLGDKC